MSGGVQFEPFLTHKVVAFNGFFTMNDPAMNTSEIKPIHLSIPKNCPGVVKNLSPRGQPTVQDMTIVRPANTRLLSSAALARTVQRPGKDAAPERRESTSPRSEQDSSRSPRPEQGSSRSPRPEPPQSKSPRPEPPASKPSKSDSKGATVGPNIGSAEDMKNFMAKPDMVVLPFTPNLGGRFAFSVSVVKGKTVYAMKSEGRKVVLWASIDSSILKGFSVHSSNSVVGRTSYDEENAVLYCGHVRDDGSSMQEVVAFQFNKSFIKKTKVRSFDIIIPVLKKIDGQGRMIPMNFEDSKSTLKEKLKRKSKEAILLKGRLPDDTGSGFDTTFSGKFEHPSPNNFLLYYEAKPTNNICAFSTTGDKDGSYILEIGYPMTAIQGFYCAIAATAPL